VLVLFAGIEVGEAAIVEVAAEGGPTMKFTAAELEMALPPRVPVIEAVSIVVEDVNVALYVPFPLSVTLDSIPALVARATAVPPLVRLFPFASLSWTVIEELLAPFATMEVGEALIVEVPVEAGPGVKVTVAELAIAELFRVPVTFAVPALVDEVSVAE
jgi:hypothetical protein